jgi:formylglycine-generating enzyme required for sulfatase activity
MKIAQAVLLFISLGLCACQDEPKEWIEPLTGLEFVLVPAGSFEMGSPEKEAGRESQETLHTVQFPQPFYLGRYEVTQAQWNRITGSNPSSFSKCGPDCPVESVSWNEVNAFLEKLNQRTAGHFRLPSEAEWEYACRAGTSTPFSTGKNLTTQQANYDGNYPYAGFPKGQSRGSPISVGSFSPNAWGLFDMHGNVWEWTSDLHCPYPVQAVLDPHPACFTSLRVIRGGSWYFGAESARSALRYTHRPQDSGFSIGFRVARSIAPR